LPSASGLGSQAGRQGDVSRRAFLRFDGLEFCTQPGGDCLQARTTYRGRLSPDSLALRPPERQDR
jgi:hypothetical protein